MKSGASKAPNDQRVRCMMCSNCGCRRGASEWFNAGQQLDACRERLSRRRMCGSAQFGPHAHIVYGCDLNEGLLVLFLLTAN